MNYLIRHLNYLLFFMLIVYSSNSFSQELTVKPDFTEITGSQFNGRINFEILNNTDDTLFIPLSPFKCETVWSPNSWCFTPRWGVFTHNKITFLRKDIKYNEGSAYNSISYLKFPDIYMMLPFGHTVFSLAFDNSVSSLITKYDWNIFFEIWFAYRKEVYSLFNSDFRKYKSEFEQALVTKDTVLINAVYDQLFFPDNPRDLFDYKFNKRINDSTLFFYKDLEKYKYDYKTDYDIILSKFSNLVE